MDPKKYYRPYVGHQFGYVGDEGLCTYITQAELTDLVDDGMPLLRLGKTQLTKLDDAWFETEIEAKRKLAILLCERLDLIRKQIDAVISEIKAAEIVQIRAQISSVVAEMSEVTQEFSDGVA